MTSGPGLPFGLRKPFGEIHVPLHILSLVLFFFFTWGGLAAALIFPRLPANVEVKVGEVSPRNFESPRKVRFVSQVLTQEAQQKVREDPANKVYTFDASASVEARAALSDVLRQLGHARSNPDLYYYEREDLVHKAWPGRLQDDQVKLVLSMSDEQWATVTAEAIRVLELAMSGRFESAELENVRSRVGEMVRPDLGQEATSLVVSLVRPLIRPTVLLDYEATKRKVEEAAAQAVVYVDLQAGESILRKGDVVKPLDLEKLQAAGLMVPDPSLPDMAGFALLGLVVAGLQTLYIALLCGSLLQRPKLLAFLAVLMVATVFIGRFAIPGHLILPYLLPLASVGMLIAVLMEVHLAAFTTVVLSVLLGILAGNSLDLTAYYVMGSFAGILAIWRAERSIRFAWAGLLVGVVSAGVAISYKLVSRDLDLLAVAQMAGAGLGNGVLSSALTFGTFSILGSLFGITTVIQLLELAHPNHPLLRRLVLEAPGTYHHSILVSNLAERAATAVEADSLLVRVAAYYHDIGKLSHPYFFVENQGGGENPHDKLDPITSAKILVAHVADGVTLARRARLPRKIVEMIQQHHGTSLLVYFFHKALLELGTVDEANFRYPGPKPHSKEAAILMLADSVEATVRAAMQGKGVGASDIGTEVFEGALETMVDKVIQQKLADGQLDECQLTLQDLRAIRGAFVQILRGVYHPRVEYPELPTRGQLQVEL